MKRKASQTRSSKRLHTLNWQQEELEDEEEEITRDEEALMALPSVLKDSEHWRTALMTDDEEDEAAVERSNGQVAEPVSNESRTSNGTLAVNGDPIAGQDQTAGRDHTASEHQTVGEHQTAPAEEAANRPPADEPSKTQTKSNQQTVQDADSTSQSNDLNSPDSQVNEDDIYVTIDSQSEQHSRYLTPPEFVGQAVGSQVVSQVPRQFTSQVPRQVASQVASQLPHQAADSQVASLPSASQTITAQAVASQAVPARQFTLNSQRFGADQLGSSIPADLDDDLLFGTPATDGETGWVSKGSMHAFKYKFKVSPCGPKKKLAAFDLDGTLITSISNDSKLPRDITDWQLKDNVLITKIKVLVKDGFNFVIFSNQLAVSRHYISLEEMKTKFESIVRHIGQPCVAVFCASVDRGLKPAIGMLEFYLNIICPNELNPQPSRHLNLQQSFFVGDSMGRPRDHSAVDLLFAYNLKMPFMSIESFLNERTTENPKLYRYDELTRYRIPGYPVQNSRPEVVQILRKKRVPNEADVDFFSCEDLVDSIEDDLKRLEASKGPQLCVILLIGLFGSGKSHFAKKFLQPKGYEVIERQTIRSSEEERQIFSDHVAEGKRRIAIDEPNLDYKQRERWIDLAKAGKAVIIGLHFDLPVDQCSHNVRFRSFYTDRHNYRTPKPDRILSQYVAFRAPDFWEGFKEIYTLDFIPSFDSGQLQVYYTQFLYPTRC